MHGRLRVLAAGLVAAGAQLYDQTSVAISDVYTTEGSDSVSFRPTLLHDLSVSQLPFASGESPVIHWETTPNVGSATVDVDYLAGSGSFKFESADSGTSALFTVTLVNDNIQEAVETFVVSLSPDAGATSQELLMDLSDTAVCYISDNEGVTVQLADSSRTEGEDNSFTFAVTLSHEVATEINLRYDTVTADPNVKTAGPGEDYEAVNNGNLRFTQGGPNRQSFKVNIVNDNIQEAVETFEVQVTYSQGFPQIEFFPPSMKVLGTFLEETEGVRVCVDDVENFAEGTDGTHMEFPVRLSHVVDTAVEVSLETVAGASHHGHIPAVEGFDGDYRYQARKVRFAAGETAKSFLVEIPNDDIQSAHARPQDMEVYGRVNFGVEYRVASNVWTGSVGGASNVFNVATCYNTAQEETASATVYDFEDVTMMIMGTTSLGEGDGGAWTFEVSLSHRVTGSIHQGGSDTYGHGPTFSLATSIVTGNAANVSFADADYLDRCVLSNQGTDVPPYAHVDVCWPRGVYPMDSVNHREEQFNQFDAAPTFKTYTFLQGANDPYIEGEEVFGVTLVLGEDSRDQRISIAAGMESAFGYIEDDDVATIEVIAQDTTLPEDDASVFTYAVIISHEVATEVSLEFETVEGTADSYDFEPGSGSLVWVPRQSLSSSRYFLATAHLQVPVVNDNVQESTETFRIEFFNALPHGLVEFDTQTRTATITDDESMSVYISSMDAAKDESDTDWLFTVTLSHEASDMIFVDVGAALPNGDGTVHVEVPFVAGSTKEVFDLPMVNDDIQEALQETLSFSVCSDEVHDLSGGIPAEVFAGIIERSAPWCGAGLLEDDEGFAIMVDDTWATEDSSQVYFNVHLSHETDTDVTVSLDTVASIDMRSEFDMRSECTDVPGFMVYVNGSRPMTCKLIETLIETYVVSKQKGCEQVGQVGAFEMCCICGGGQVATSTMALDTDYVSLADGSSIVIREGLTSGIASVSLTNDNVQEFYETFELDVGYKGLTDSAVATIIDVELVTVTIRSVAGSENTDDFYEFEVRLSHAVGEDVTLTYDLLDGSAVIGDDFAPTVKSCADLSFTPAKAYVAQDVGTCPFYDANIESIEECRWAATQLGLPEIEPSDIREKTYPYGCYFKKSVGELYWNSGGKPNEDEDRVSLCKMWQCGDQSTWPNVDGVVCDDCWTLVDSSGKAGETYTNCDEYCESFGHVCVGAAEEVNEDCNVLQVYSCSDDIGLLEDTSDMLCQCSGGLSLADIPVSPQANCDAVSTNPEVCDDLLYVNLDEYADDGFNFGGVATHHLPCCACGGGVESGVTGPVEGRTHTLVIPALERTGTITVMILNDDIQEIDETFTVRLRSTITPDMGISVYSEDPAVGTIRDDEDVTVDIAGPPGAVNKLAGSMDFTLTISHLVSYDVYVPWTTVAMTASELAGDVGDFVADSGTIFIPAMTVPGVVQVISVTLVEDACQVPPGDRTLRVTITKPPAFTSGSSSAVGTISWEDMHPTLYIEPSIAHESDEEMIFTVVLSHCISEPINVGYTVPPNTYYLVVSDVSPSITFEADAGAYQTQTFTVEVQNDNVQGPPKVFAASLSSNVQDPPASMRVVMEGQSTTGTINDDEGVTVSITDCADNRLPQGEFSNELAFQVGLSHLVAEAVFIDWSTRDYTAISEGDDPDFVAASDTIEFPAFSSEPVEIEIEILDKPDALRPGQAVRFYVEMEVASISGGWQTDEVTVAGEGKGSIAGNEQGILYLPDAVEISEDAGVHTFSVMLDVDVSEPVEIRYFVSAHQSSPQDITTEATEGLDFVRVDGEDGDLAELATLVFLPHQGPNQTLTFDVAIIDDWLQEATEKFDVNFEVLTPTYRDVIDVESFVTDNGHSIIDNDFAEITFQQHVDGNSALPSGFEATGILEFDVTLSHFVYTDVTVTLFTQEKAGLFSATSGVDYTEVVTTVVRFPGSPDIPVATPDGDTQHLDVVLANDNVQEVPETFSLMANQVVVVGATDYTLNFMSDSHYSLTEIGTATLGDIEVAVGTIYDDEGTTAVINSGAINEGDHFTFEVTLSHPLAYPIAVDVSLIGYGANDDLHAVEGLNYPASWGTTLNFAPAEISARTVTVETIENSVLQPEVQFQLHVEPSYNFITTAEGQGVVTILLDTESAHLHVVAEDFVEGQAASMQVHVEVIGGDDQTPVQIEPGFTWEYHTDSLTAVAGDDFEDTSGSVTFNSLDVVHFDFGVTVVDDHLVETTEHFDLHLDMVETWLDFGIDMEGVYPVPIHDQENAILTVDASRAWEDSGEMIFTVFLSHGLEGDFQLRYQTLTADESECNDRTCPAWDAGRPVADGVATIDGKDFEPVVDGLTDVMTGDGTPQQHFYINVDIVDDFVAEVQEYFYLEVTGVVPGYVFEIANPASGTIGDREMATVSIVDRTVTNEDVGTVTLDVTLSHRAQPDVIVTYRTYAGTANDHEYVGQTQVFNKDFEPVYAGIITFKSAFTPNLVDYVQTQLQQIDITLVDDHVLEEDEQFCVTLGDELAPADVSVYVPRSGRDGWVELQQDHEHVTVSIEDATTLNEAGELNFAITLSHAVESADVDVRWRTQSSQSAIAVGGDSPNGADFVMVPFGVTTIPRSIGGGMTEFAIVQSIDDPVSEGVETFEVALVDIGPIVAADSTGVNGPIVPNLEETIYVTPGTIAVGYISDLIKGIPVLSIRDDEDEEGSTFEFVVDLDMPIDEDLLIHYTTAISSNTQFGRDVDFQEGDITIAAGAYSSTIRITLPENNIVQPERTFFVDITLPVVSHVVFGKSRATGTITDNDKAMLSMHSATFWEGTAPSMQFEVRSDRLIELAVPFMWTTSGTAGIEVDGNQEAVFPSQSFNAYVEVTVTNDNIQESDETFQLLGLSIEPQGQNVEWGSNQATGTIMDDEGATISIIDQQTTEDLGSNFRFEVKLSHKVSRDYTAMYRISDVTFFNEGQSPAGTADFDNLQRDGVVTFAVCSTCDDGPVADILLHVEDDQIAEYTEAVQIEIINPEAPITVAKGSAYFTIVDNDFATLDIAAAEGFETDGAMRFQVTLSHELSEDTSFQFETVPSSLVPTLGYGFATGEGTPLISQSMLYQPDYLLKTEDIVLRQKGNAEFFVELVDDTEQELDEIFMVRATGSGLLDGQVFEGTGAIINDDEGVVMSAVEFATDDDGHTTFTVTLSHAVDSSELSILLESADPLVVSATYTDAVAPHTKPVTLTGHIDVTEYDSVIDHIPVTVAATLPSGLSVTASTEVLVEPNHHRISPLAPIAMADLCSHGVHGKYEDNSHLEVHVHPGVKALIKLEDCFFDANYNDHQFVLMSDADEGNVYIEDGILHIDDVSEELELSVFASDSAGEAELHIHIHFEELEPVSLAQFSMNGMTVHHGETRYALINRVMGDAECEADGKVAHSTCEVAGDGEVLVTMEGTGNGITKFCIGEESTANCGTVTVPVSPAAVATKGLLFAVDGETVYYPLHIFGGKPDAFGHYHVHCHAQGAASEATYKLGVVSAQVTEGDSAILCVVNDHAGAQSTSTVTIRTLGRC